MRLLITVFLFIITLALSAQEWQKNFSAAKEKATVEQLPIILVFQGSDWCGPCIKLDHEIWSTTTFKEYAKSHFVMLQADFPRKKKNALPDAQAAANAELAERYNTRGIFPLVVKLDGEGNVVGETGYQNMSPQDYINHLEAL